MDSPKRPKLTIKNTGARGSDRPQPTKTPEKKYSSQREQAEALFRKLTQQS